MPLETRSLAQGIPPRVREPTTRKPSKKKSASTSNKKPRKKKKVVLTSSEESGEDESSSSESDRPPKKKRKKKAVREENSELEEVDAMPPKKVVEVVVIDDDGQGGDPIVVSDHDDGLNTHQRGEALAETVVKKELTLDLLTIMSDRVTVKFVAGDGKQVTESGRWCNVCKNDENFLKSSSKRKAFHKGGNSSCRVHIRHHYEIYKERCTKDNIPINHWAIPRPLWNAMESEKEALRTGKLSDEQKQQTLQFEKVTGPREFTRQGVLNAVCKQIATNNQPLALADNPAFRNSLVAMRPKSTRLDLPTTRDVKIHIHNEFVKHIEQLKQRILELPGKVSITSDAWSADTTKMSFLGMTAHFIEVKDKKWTLKAEVIGFKAVSGAHSGSNLGRYAVGLLDRVGIMGKDHSKLYTATLDNTSNNDTTCKTIAQIHTLRKLPEWNPAEQQLPCLAHVINLANVDVMRNITKIAAVENATAIWEYDPSKEDNRVLGGTLDVISAIRTIAIKIQASGQRIEYFQSLQIRAGLSDTLTIPLHSNIRWGTAYKMLDRAITLRQPIVLFLVAADEMYGPITTVRRSGRIVKHIPWSAFKMSESDWQRVGDVRDILADSNRVQQHFSSDKQPTLWRSLPALEELQTTWEKKRDNPKYALYGPALNQGLDKLRKYYSRLDDKPAFVLGLVLHPYYKLEYIKLAWGGPIEQAAQITAGDLGAKDWHDEAKQIVERTMSEYYNNRPTVANSSVSTVETSSHNAEGLLEMSEFDRHRENLLSNDVEEGWASELRRYLATMQKEITKQTDVVKWWQDSAEFFPTLARIALDVLPAQASSVPCERLFSGMKQVATDRRASLGAEVFEELAIMGSTWRHDIYDMAAMNTSEVEAVETLDFDQFLAEDTETLSWEKDLDVQHQKDIEGLLTV